MVRDDGGGGSGEAVSSDGLIYPEAFWGKSRDVDTEAIRTSAASLRALGVAVSTKTDEINTVWNELPASYVSPEAWRVYTLMGPAVSKADGIEDRFARGAGYLETFADELDFIKPRLADLEVRANAFRAKALAGIEVTTTQVYPSGESVETTSTLGWKEDTDTVAKNKALLGEYFAIVEQITMSSDTCARGLRALAGTQQWLSPTGSGGQVGVITADQLAGAGVLPFGAPVDEDRNCGESVGDGIIDFGKGLGEGAGMLVLGYNPETGDFWDGGAYGQAWGGLGNLAGSMAVLGMFAVPGVNVALVGVASQNEEVAGWIDDRADVVVGAAGSLIGYDHATVEAGGDGWHQWKEDGVRTATTSVLNIGTFFIPGAGAIGGGAKAGSIAAKVGSAASVAAEVIVPGGSWLLKGGVNAVRFGETAVTVARGGTAAVLDTTRLGKAGVLTSLDNITEHTGYTPTRPRPTETFNLEGATKPAPASPGVPDGLHMDTPTNPAPHGHYNHYNHYNHLSEPAPSHPLFDPDRANIVETQLRDTFGENPYELPDYIPDELNASHADIPAPERVPALVGATEREAGRPGEITAGHATTITDSVGTPGPPGPPGPRSTNPTEPSVNTGSNNAGGIPAENGGRGRSGSSASGNRPPGYDELDAYEAGRQGGDSTSGDHNHPSDGDSDTAGKESYGLMPIGRGMDDCDEAAYQGVLHIRDEIRAEGGTGNHSWAKSLTDDQLASYLDSYSQRTDGQELLKGGVAWYDPERGLFVVKKSTYSMSAYELPYDQFLRKLK